MAVITRFIVVRNGKELDKVFEEKKLAEAYDKMLDAAENLAAFIKQGELQIDLDAKTIDDISIYLAKNGPEVTKILKGIKPIASTEPAAAKTRKARRSDSAHRCAPNRQEKSRRKKKPDPRKKRNSRR